MKNVINYLKETVSLHPQKKAVIDSESCITFKELWDASERTAASLLSRGIGINSPIGVYLPKGCKMVEAFAGINMSGCFYVPLDVKSPDTRVQSIITTMDIKCVITDNKYSKPLSNLYKGSVLIIGDDTSAELSNNQLRYEHQIDVDPVYSIFTSGSTGTPKGVTITHRGVIDYIDWAVSCFGIDSQCIIGNQAPFYFDNSTLDIYLMYATGATLNIIPDFLFSFPAKLVEYLDEHEINFVFWVPSVFVNIANMDIFRTKKPKYLKNVFFAGEVMPNKHLNYWRKYLPTCRYVNLYGPTEITVDCTYYEVKRAFLDDEPLPIGIPRRNSGIMVLVDRKRVASRGEQGELCVRGSSLALGYYNNHEKTKSAFIQNPLNNHYPEKIYCTGDIVYENEQGEIMYVGRVDNQIKHNGYRIELGEIETAVHGCGIVDNCCVVYNHAEKKIVLFYQSVKPIEKAVFNKVLSTKIPHYMIPTEYRHVDRIEQNNNGKVDRAHYNKIVQGMV